MKIKKTTTIHEFDKFINKKIKIQYLSFELENKIDTGKIVQCSVGKQTIVTNGLSNNTCKPFVCTFINENNQEIKINFDSIIEIDII